MTSLSVGQNEHVRARIGGVAGLWLGALFAVTLGLAVASQFWLGGFASDLRWSDESAHYINGLLIHDWLQDGAPFSPLAYAQSYYTHFPKVSIGHWPPFFYGIEAIAFFLFGHAPVTGIVLQAFFTALLATLVGFALAARGSRAVATMGALATVSSPIILWNIQGIMLDVPVACLVFAAAIQWALYLETRSWRWSLGFALLASMAILTKGNAFCLAFLPAFALILRGDWKILRHWSFWLPAPVVGFLVVPWYVATRGMIDGFNYHAGITFFLLAARRYGGDLPQFIGWLGLILALAGAIRILAARDRRADPYGIIALALVSSVLLFHCLVPMDIEQRYIAAIVPGLIILAAGGAQWIASRFPTRVAIMVPPALLALLILAEPAPHHKHPIGMDAAAAAILHAGSAEPFVLIGATPGGEGSFIAALANGDRLRRSYAVRGFSVLGAGNWMGDDYKPRFATDAAAAKWIEESGIGWMVIEESEASLAWKHNQQLLAVARSGRPGWLKTAEFDGAAAHISVYRISVPEGRPSDHHALLRELAPAKALSLQ